MLNPKKEVFKILSLLNYNVSQQRQNVFNELPIITFRIEENNLEYSLDKEILSQEIIVVIDLWGETSIDVSKMLDEVEQIMRNHNFYLSTSKDVSDDELYHMYTRFYYVRG